MTLTEEQFKQEYDKRYFENRLEKLNKILEKKPENLFETIGYLHIANHRDKMSNQIRKAEYLHNHMIKHPDSTTESGLDPTNKKVFIKPSCQISEGYIIEKIFELEGALFTNSLNDADIGVYVGTCICDYEGRVNMDETGSAAIWPLLEEVKNRSLSLIVITNGNEYFKYCARRCPEDKFMADLINQGKNINHIPLGYPYNKAIPLDISF